MSIEIHKILRSNRALLLSLDQGLEHGPTTFNEHTIDPEHLLDLALETQYTGVVLTPGLAQKYYRGAYKDVPLVVKLNGKSSLGHLDPDSRQFCSVEHAVKLGADAVGYTIYDGSAAEARQFQEFGAVVEQAHSYGIPVIAWMYPRGAGVHEHDTDTIAYAARIGLELGTDFVKVKYNGDPAGFEWVCKSAGRAHVLAADADFPDTRAVLQYARDVTQAGAAGLALGRTVWEHPRPFSLARALNGILFHDKSVEEVLPYLEENQ